MTASDLEKDGNVDLLVTNGTSKNLAVLRNLGNRELQSPENYGVAQLSGALAWGAAASDFNNDGAIDVAVANGNDDTVSILSNTLVDGSYRINLTSNVQNVDFGIVTSLDFGDAPDTSAGVGPGNYNTLDADNGPSHVVVADLHIGDLVDAEADAAPSEFADGDDLLADRDEDGIDPQLTFSVGNAAAVDAVVTNLTSNPATLYGWIDFDADGLFELSERASVSVPIGTDNQTRTLNWASVPAGYDGTSYARFRLSSDTAAENPTGPAADGEVEDYRVLIHDQPMQIATALPQSSDGAPD